MCTPNFGAEVFFVIEMIVEIDANKKMSYLNWTIKAPVLPNGLTLNFSP